MAIRRITKEFKELQTDPLPNYIDIRLVDDDLFKWSVSLVGSENTPHKGGQFFIEMTFPQDYPFKPMKIKLLTKIYHCNLSAESGNNCFCCGTMCFKILKDNWSPALTAKKVLLAIYQLLNNPDPERAKMYGSGRFCGPAKLYKTNIKEYNKKAREWTLKYAGYINKNKTNDEPDGDGKDAANVDNDDGGKLEQKQNDVNKTWNCSICTFCNVEANRLCIMCGVGECPDTDSNPIYSDNKSISQQKSMVSALNENTEEEVVKMWLRNEVKLPQYIQLFMDEGYDDMVTITGSLKENDLLEMGIKKKGHRKKIMIFINEYKNRNNNNNNI
eukprot:222754_1